MALENLTPAVRVEAILNGDDIQPANRLEYFLQKAATSGSENAPLIVDLTDATNRLGTNPEGGSLDYETDADLTDAIAAFGTTPVFFKFKRVEYDGDSTYIIGSTVVFGLAIVRDDNALIVMSYIVDDNDAAVPCNYYIYNSTP